MTGLDLRKSAFDNICKVFAIMRYDIEHHQAISDYSLNIHGENYFRDVFNYIYDSKFVNANFDNANVASIDLVDNNSKLAYQITTTTKKTKIDNTLKILIDDKNDKYHDYEIKIYYLLEKPKLSGKSINTINETYGVDVEKEVIKNYEDVIREINNLPHDKIIELDNLFFKKIAPKYTDKIVLDLTIKHLLSLNASMKINYSDTFGTIESNRKLELNNINQRISANINSALDYNILLAELDKDDSILEKLRELIVSVYYRNILQNLLKEDLSIQDLIKMDINHLHKTAKEKSIDFNDVLFRLYECVTDEISIKDFNSMDISWIIIAYFFEICDIGIHK